MSEYECKDCKIMLIYSEVDGKSYELYSHKIHICPKREKKSNNFNPYSKSQRQNQEKVELHDYDNYPRKPASVILCPVSTCNKAMVQREENEKQLVEQFIEHMTNEHLIRPSKFFLDRLHAKIILMRRSRRYLDPFVGVEVGEITREQYAWVQ